MSAAETVGRHETSLTRSLALGRRPWVLGAAAAIVVAGAAIGFLAGRGAAPTRTATLPVPTTSAAPSALVVRLPRTSVAALPALRTAGKKRKKTQKPAVAPSPATQGSSHSPSPAAQPPGYTIVGG